MIGTSTSVYPYAIQFLLLLHLDENLTAIMYLCLLPNFSMPEMLGLLHKPYQWRDVMRHTIMPVRRSKTQKMNSSHL